MGVSGRWLCYNPPGLIANFRHYTGSTTHEHFVVQIESEMLVYHSLSSSSWRFSSRKLYSVENKNYYYLVYFWFLAMYFVLWNLLHFFLISCNMVNTDEYVVFNGLKWDFVICFKAMICNQASVSGQYTTHTQT